MLFGSLQYLVFFTVVFVVTWLCASNTWRKVILVAASYLFYAYWDWRFLSLVIFVTLCAWGSTQFIGKLGTEAQRRVIVIISVALQLSVLGFFKYFNFFGDSVAVLARALGAHVDSPTLAIILPVGLSFYVFHSISYTVDGFKGKVKPSEFSIVDVALYIAFFPQLIAGPIVRGLDFLPQLRSLPVWSSAQAARAIRLIAIGFMYKYLLADNLGLVADQVFKEPAAWNGLSLWSGVASYYAQIYFDFAGYSWMAIGCAGLLGYILPTNFDFPYTALSTTEFWRRWHISLSTWLRDYLFIPLGGSRRGQGRYYANVFVTMGLGGLWHGASWNFVVWGILHGIGLTVHKWVTGERAEWAALPAARLSQIVSALGITQLWVMLLWVFFRAQSFHDSMTILTGMFGLRNVSALQSVQVSALILPLLLVALDGALGRATEARSGPRAIPLPVYGAALGFVVAMVLFGTVMANKPFIYFQF